MSPSPTSPEIERVAERYRERGYYVDLDPKPDMLPPEVRDYRPDFVALRDFEKVAVEVKRRADLAASPFLTRLAEQFRQVPGWRLDVALIEEPKAQAEPQLSFLSSADISFRFDTAQRAGEENKDYGAAVLLFWTIIEAALLAQLRDRNEERVLPPKRLAKTAYSFGVVDDARLPVLEWLANIRNDVVHGRQANLAEDDYSRAKTLTRQILDDWKTNVEGS